MTLFWALVVVVLVLLIPLLAIVIDSQIGHALARRIAREAPPGELEARLETLEGELQYMSASLEGLREESSFLRQLVEERSDSDHLLEAGEPERSPETTVPRGAAPGGSATDTAD